MGELAGLVAAMIWAGTSIAFTRFAGRTAPAVISALRLGSASLVLPLILLASGEAGDLEAASWQTLAWVVLSGALAYAVGDTLYIRALSLIGMQRTFPITMGLFIALTVVGGIVLLDEDFTWGLPVGAALIAIGISLIVVPRAEDGPPEPAPGEGDLVAADPPGPPPWRGSLAGYVLLVLVGIFWAAASLVLAGKRGDLGAIAAGSIRAPAGAVALLGFTAALQPKELAAPFRDRRHLGGIVLAGLLGTGIGSMLYVYAVLEAGPGKAAVLSATAPLMALPLSILFLKERPTRLIAAGTLLCVAGIVLVVR
ncbi:MAG TPA: DMT family transporter [Tepidiformaceae bacterium]|nr:DMT family transporter [Tepidiformaceae bacterium]